jgi:hypothetical protein
VKHLGDICSNGSDRKETGQRQSVNYISVGLYAAMIRFCKRKTRFTIKVVKP